MSSPEISKLFKTIKKLRHPTQGCPWDLKQTNKSLIKYLIEESYEAIYAIENEDSLELKDELGDVLLQVLLHSIIKEETGEFSLQDVIDNLEEKIIRRHPHVFAGEVVSDVQDVKHNWQKIKKKENEIKHKDQSKKISKKQLALPALLSSLKIGTFTNEKNFDWVKTNQVILKVEEELNELKAEIVAKNKSKTKEELGDVLFTMAQLSRHLGFCPEEVLKSANSKFAKRYNKMVDLNKGEDIKDLSPKKKEKLWLEVKKTERKNNEQQTV